MITISHEPIDFAALTESVRSNQAGAVVLFLGTVREMTDGRQTVALDYEAYPAMARGKIEELLTEAREKWPIVNAAIEHRLGRLEPGDVSVALAVSTPHREQAFEAGKYLIDRLKEVVPIWKKENWADGTTEWVHPGAESSATDPNVRAVLDLEGSVENHLSRQGAKTQRKK
jgi:molybdopterin synthase catalytic subunit